LNSNIFLYISLSVSLKLEIMVVGNRLH